MLTLATPHHARADEETVRIDGLIAENRSRQALPIALERARRLRFDVAAWQRVRQIAAWNALTDSEIEALEALVLVRPEQRDLRFSLAQRLLWKKRTEDALPHVRWLLSHADESDPVALEVCVWVLAAEKETTEARRAAERWLVAANDAATRSRARWAIADLTHWSVRWREARAAYRVLERTPGVEAAARMATERLELLRHERPDETRLEGNQTSDNFGNAYRAVAATSDLQLPWRLVAQPRTEVGRWSRTGYASLTSVAQQLRLRAEPWEALRPELLGGVEADSARHVVPYGSAGARLAIAGRFFGRVAIEYDRLRVGLEPIRRDVRAVGPVYSLYAEPLPWLVLASEGQLTTISDDNLRTRLMGLIGSHNTGRWQLEPRFVLAYDRYRDYRPGALPYFTPSDPWSFGWELIARGVPLADAPRAVVKFEAGIAFVLSAGAVAVRPSATLRAELGRHMQLMAGTIVAGTSRYFQTRFDASVGWLF